jgi:hypothetical protein
MAKIVSASCLGVMLLNLASPQHPWANLTHVQPSAHTPTVQPSLPPVSPARQQPISSPTLQAPTPQPTAPRSQERRPDETAVRQAEQPSSGPGSDSEIVSNEVSKSPRVPPTDGDVTLLPIPESKDKPAPLLPPIHMPLPSPSIGQPLVSPVETALPKLDPSLSTDATQIRQRLFDLGFLPTPPIAKWGQRPARALQESRAAHNLNNNAVWPRLTEDILLSSPAAPRAEPMPLFVGNWRLEAGSCAGDSDGPPLRITRARAETAGGRCEFDSVRRESEGAWHVRAKCSVNRETWQTNIQFHATGERLIWTSERGRAQYLRCR